MWEAVAVEYPGVAGYRQGAAACLHNLGNLRAVCGRPRQAEEAYRAALALRAWLAENFPQGIGYRQELAASQFALGMLLSGIGRFAEAEQLQRDAYRTRSELASASAGINEFRRDLAASHYGFARLLAATGRPHQAEEGYRAALALLDSGSDAPTPERPAPPGRQELIRTKHHFGLLLAQLGRYDEAEKLYRQSLAACEESAVGCSLPTACAERGELYSDLGRLLHTVGRTAEAGNAYRRAVEVCNASDSTTLAVLAEARDRFGALLLEAGRTGEAAKCFEVARRYRLQLAGDCPEVPAFQGELAWFLAHCPDGSFRDAARAVACASKACDLAPLDGNQWLRSGAAHYRAGDWRGAAAALEKAVERGNGFTPADWLFLAMSRWQMGEKQEADKCYRRVRSYLDKHGPVDEEMRRFLAEAAALISRPGAGTSAVDQAAR